MKFITILKKYKFNILLVFIFVCIQTHTDLTLPEYMSKIVDNGIVKGDTNYILKVGISMLILTLIGAIATIIVSFFASRTSAGVSKDLRKKVFDKVESFSLEEIKSFSKASLITRTTNDVTQIQMTVFMVLRILIQAPIMGIGAIVKVFKSAPSMTWILTLAVGLLITIIIMLFIIAMPKFKIFQKLIDRLNLVTRENLTGIRVIRAFNNEEYQEQKFDNANIKLTKNHEFINKVMIFMQPVTTLIINLTIILVIWIGSHRVDAGTLEIGSMMAFIQYSMQVMISFMMLSMIFIMIPRSKISLDRIMEVLNTDIKIKNPKNIKKAIKEELGKIEFKNVSFKYSNADYDILHNISFTCDKGKTTAFIGSTGSGKSTLINLIPRFYDVTSGEIFVNGVNVKDYDLKDLRNHIGYVPQKGVLLSGTIKSNIMYGKELNDNELDKISKVSQSYEFITKKENAFNSEISQGGKNVSGGQKQRLSIARALAQNPDIFIFDDSFSALDYKTDKTLRKELKKYTKDATILIVAQRINTIRNADKIIVLDNGEIVGMGTHKNLLKTCKIYNEIALSQLSKEEL